MKTAALGEIAQIVSGATPKTGTAEFWGGDVMWATPADLSKLDGPYIAATPRKITQAGVRSCATTILPAGSVLLSSRAPIGHVAINTIPMATNQGFKSLVPGPSLDAKYLYHWLKSKTAYLQSLGNGATFKELSKKTAEQIQIPIPPLPEQRRIAAILDHADALRAKRRRIVTHLDYLTQSIYFSMFERESWTTRPLVELADSADDIRCGPFGTQLNVSEFRSSGVPLLGIKNVNAKFKLQPFEFLDESTATRLSQYDLRPGDLVMTRKGTIGNCAIYPESLPAGVMHSDLLRARISPSAADVVFLEHHLQKSPRISHQIKMMSPGAVMPGINVTKLKQLAVDTPPLALQHEFAARVAELERQRAAVERALAADDELFTSLQSRAFRGKL